MPNLEPVVVQQDQIRIRHIGPKASVWPGAPVALEEFTVLSRTDMVARPLPISNVPGTRDFVSGSWTLRLDDAGEATLVFPNTDASDGAPWRSRFDVTGHLQFLEIYFNGELDFVGVIDQVTPTQASVTVHCDDAFWLLKKAYARDITVTQAPRDVIERCTQAWVAAVTDNFPGDSTIAGSTLTTPLNTWALGLSSGATATVQPTGGVAMMVPATSGAESTVSSATVACTSTVWSAQVSFGARQLDNTDFFGFAVLEDGSQVASLAFYGGIADFFLQGDLLTQAAIPMAAFYTLLIESDGEWLTGYVNGVMVGCAQRPTSSLSTIETSFSLYSNGVAGTAVVSGVLLETLEPFLMR
jgi:hypothetical protein